MSEESWFDWGVFEHQPTNKFVQVGRYGIYCKCFTNQTFEAIEKAHVCKLVEVTKTYDEAVLARKRLTLVQEVMES